MPRSERKIQSTNRLPALISLLVLVAGFFAYQWLLGLSWRLLLIVATLVLTILLLLIRWSTNATHRRKRSELFQDSAYTLSPQEFTERVRLLLQDLGWQQVARVPEQINQIIDLYGFWDGKRYIVQCRRYKGVVNPAIVRELGALLPHTRADRALLITTGHFSLPTRAWAEQQFIDLWDAEELAWQVQNLDEGTHAQRRFGVDRRLIGLLAVLNSLSLLITLFVPDQFLPFANEKQAQLSISRSPTPPSQSVPSATVPLSTIAPTSAPTVVPTPEASVFNGGNIREQPDLQARVVGQVNAGEMVKLLAKSETRQWYNITNPRGVTGWVHVSLLKIDTGVDENVPISIP